MPAETAELETKRSALALMVRRVPFTLLLRGCTTASIQAAAPTVSVPRNYKVKARDGEIFLRNYGAPMSPTWSVKARMEDTIDGVRVAGRLRGALDRCYFFLFALTAVVCLGATVATGIGNGLGDSAFLACCTISVILCGVVLLLLLLHPGVLAKREAAAKEMLRGLFETA